MYPEPLHPAASNLTPRPTASTVTSPYAPVLQNIQRVSLIVRNPFRTTPSGNSFGFWKEYLYRPSHDLVALISPEDQSRPHASAKFSQTRWAGSGPDRGLCLPGGRASPIYFCLSFKLFYR
jgi:hypothetical protein